ncbi:MAG: hypothetical protein HKN42_12235 [Granulosicoccus sp.]|nr:hypothetical protein [Granulosicoccus sp.]
MPTSSYRFLCHTCLFVLIAVLSSSCSSNDDGQVLEDESIPFNGVVDFESLLENAFIDGQDNWRDHEGSGQAVVSLDATASNGTQVVEPLLETALNAPVELSRQNDDVFAFPGFTSSDDGHFMQFDLTAEGMALMALGSDADGDGIVSPAAGETGPLFGIVDGNFQLQGAGKGQVLQAALGPGDATADWYQLRLQWVTDSIDGHMTGSVFYRNLTDQDTEFRQVDGLQDVDLELDSNALLVQSDSWDTVYVHLQSSGGRTPAMDNLLPHGSSAE